MNMSHSSSVSSRTHALAGVGIGLVLVIISNPAARGFDGGDGSAADPYQVASAAHLNEVRNHLAAHFVQTADIDLGMAPWNEGGGWQPIGTSVAGTRFTGTYDGGGFTIANLSITRSETSDQGLFGYLDGATVRGLNLSGVNVLGGGWVGSLAGRAYQSVIELVEVSGGVEGVTSGWYVGGLVGLASGGAVHRVAGDVAVKGEDFVGGLVGYLTGSGEIRHSSVRGSVVGNSDVGGLVGVMNVGTQIISDCYSRAAVSGQKQVGGLVGYLWAGLVSRCYSSGTVSGPEGVASVGGFTGLGGNARDCFWDVESSGRETSGGGSGLSTLQMQDPASFRNFNFHSLWTMETGGYPVFRDFSGYAPPLPVALASLGGSGTAEDPYLLTNASELHAMRLDLAAHYRLGNDIDLRDAVLWDMGRGWSPVGTSTTGQRFTGTLDGAGFTIQNLAINRPPTANQGLLGYLEGATLRDLRLAQANLQCGATSGLLAGQARQATIERVSAQGRVRSGGNQVGGVVGQLYGGVMHRADVNGVIQGANQVGGLVGYLTASGEIQRSSARGSATGGSDVGGLVGQMFGGTQLVNDCYSRAAVSGETRVGGLVGYLWAGSVASSYATGMVSPTSSSASSLGGLTGAGSTVVAGYWDTQTSGWSQSAGGEGRTSAAMTYPHAPDTYLDWDFADIWAADTDGSVNGGYPYLQTTGPNPQPGGPFTLVYQTGAGGTLVGPALQTVEAGATASDVQALAEPGAIFAGWSDGDMANPRGEQNVSRDIQATARFESAGGVDIDWYAAHGIAPGEGQTWSDLDSLDWLGKGMTLREEFLAGTDPNDPASRFYCEPPQLYFNPNLQSSFPESVLLRWTSVAGRMYGIDFSTDLLNWSPLLNNAANPLILPASEDGETTEWISPPPLVEEGNPLFFRIKVIP